MKAADFVVQQLRGDDSYGARFVGQPRISVTVRLPVELVAWLDAFKSAGLGNSRNSVLQILLDAGIDEVKRLDPIFSLDQEVDAIQDEYIFQLGVHK